MKYEIKITPNDRGNPPGKLADAELHFTADAGPLDGLKLIGFGIWEARDRRRSVTFPARQYAVNGERRSFALLRPIVDTTAHDRIRARILEAFAEYEARIDADPAAAQLTATGTIARETPCARATETTETPIGTPAPAQHDALVAAARETDALNAPIAVTQVPAQLTDRKLDF